MHRYNIAPGYNPGSATDGPWSCKNRYIFNFLFSLPLPRTAYFQDLLLINESVVPHCGDVSSLCPLLFSCRLDEDATVILLIFNADPVNITWAVDTDAVDAIMECYYPAQSTGVALYNVLTGVVSPGGRLPYTWPASLDQVMAPIQ